MISLDMISIYALLTLAVSVFALTSLDTGTRLSRFMFAELFLKDDEKSYKDAKGARRILAHPLFGTSVGIHACSYTYIPCKDNH